MFITLKPSARKLLNQWGVKHRRTWIKSGAAMREQASHRSNPGTLCGDHDRKSPGPHLNSQRLRLLHGPSRFGAEGAGTQEACRENRPPLELHGGKVTDMKMNDEECVRVRTEVWLRIGADAPVKVQTRKLSSEGVFLEYNGRISGRSADVIFPDGRAAGFAGKNRVSGTLTRCAPDGVWIRFDRKLRSVSELLMRSSLAVPTAGISPCSVGPGPGHALSRALS